MLESKETQFSLSPNGQILWQEKVNNPLPGRPVAQLVKGSHPLSPNIEVIDNDITAPLDVQRLKNHFSLWMNGHLNTILEPLMLLGVPSTNESEDAVAAISKKVYDGLGIVERSDLEADIALLDPEKRSLLRNKKIRLGPILVFIPALTKPAAIRLRALLWAIYNDQALPVNIPSDGMVSVKIIDENANPAFYRAIGYPLYGGKAIRIDMLDRVINAVYENAKDGKFQAKHQMAEWLGASIEDLYSILSDMGHKKIEPKQEEASNQSAENAENNSEVTVSQDNQSEILPEETIETNPEVSLAVEQNADVKTVAKVPELAYFWIKRGKAFEKSGGGKKNFKANKKNDGSQKSFDNKKTSGEKSGDKEKAFDKNKKKKFDKKNAKDDRPRIISIEAKKKDDSPFAILQQLKK